jgi:hypothetical protein
VAEKTPYQALNPINGLIDGVLGDDSGVCISYSSNGNVEIVDLETEALYVSEVNSLYDENDRPIDPELLLAQRMVDLISKLEQVKTALLKKYPPKPPTGGVRIEKSELFGVPAQVVVLPPGMSVDDCPDDFGQEDIATADAAASHAAGNILRVAGLVGQGLPSIGCSNPSQLWA